VGGGIRTIERATRILNLGATKVILGSSLFSGDSVNIEFVRSIAEEIGPERLIAAVDGKGGKVVVNGWRTSLALTPAEAIRILEPFFSEFLYTHVDLEGLMKGTDMDAIRALRSTTTRALTAAGGITTHEEIDQLDGMNVDAVVGMALYTGKLKV
jgi:phosphoribosylformimino-5-aminoimidazole carboxamide ribotide isomerase